MSIFDDFVSVCPPGKSSCLVRIRTWVGDTSEALATRVARNYPVGTLIGYNGSKWVSLSRDPAKVELEAAVKKRQEELAPASSRSPVSTRPSAPPVAKTPSVAPPAKKPSVAPPVAKTSQPPSSGRPHPGEVWRPKDPRRKGSFTIKVVRGDELVADDGRTIKLDRMSRYQKVG